jgi:hypothetical protein
MLRGFRWLALAGVLTTAALVGPSAALACDHSGSAVSIYTNCTETASGGHKPKPPVKHTQPPASSHQTQTTTYWTPPPVKVSHKAQHALKNAGRDKKVLKHIVTHDLAGSKPLKPILASAPLHESSLGSAVDLGAGPTIFFALLLGTVLVLLGSGGVRAWRNRHRV